jgi:GSH-dependent disulfide-bond oxidoreductase
LPHSDLIPSAKANTMTPIQLYTYQTPNGHKASIMLEETGLPYTVHIVDIHKGEQNAPGYLALNPNNKIPTIVDPDHNRTVFESGAILLYLAERSSTLKPQSDAEASLTLQWMFFQAAHVGPTLGQLGNYKVFADEKIPSVIERFEKETERVLHVLNSRLGSSAYLASASYGVADVMTWPWIHAAAFKLGVDFGAFPHLARWHSDIGVRPAVQRGLLVPVLPEPAPTH